MISSSVPQSDGVAFTSDPGGICFSAYALYKFNLLLSLSSTYKYLFRIIFFFPLKLKTVTKKDTFFLIYHIKLIFLYLHFFLYILHQFKLSFI
jgi:hypothetical protein